MIKLRSFHSTGTHHDSSSLDGCKVLPYTPSTMIRSFRHKGLKSLHLRGDTSAVRFDHVARLRRLLASLDVAQ
ncbi:hypothetical protein N5D31_25535, partial [Pseudomonas sp. GD03867]|nr:hypothetical protein [Pseudomonas sp. GD03867]